MNQTDSTGYDNRHAQAIYETASKARECEEEARSFIRSHDIVTALSAACSKLSVSSVRVMVEYSENTEQGTPIGIEVGPSGGVSIRYKTSHGASSRDIQHVSPELLEQVVKLLETDQFGSAAEGQVDSLASPFIQAGEAIPDDD